jgi:hypothetical protein
MTGDVKRQLVVIGKILLNKFRRTGKTGYCSSDRPFQGGLSFTLLDYFVAEPSTQAHEFGFPISTTLGSNILR